MKLVKAVLLLAAVVCLATPGLAQDPPVMIDQVSPPPPAPAADGTVSPPPPAPDGTTPPSPAPAVGGTLPPPPAPAPAAGGTPPVNGSNDGRYPTIRDAAVALNLTSFLAAIEAANLTALATDPAARANVFAPSDAAFAALEAQLPGASTNQALLQQLVPYHVIRTFAADPNVPTPPANPIYQPTALNTAANVTNGKITFQADPFNPNSTLALGVAPGATLTMARSVLAAQARIYLLDRVLIPVSTQQPIASTPAFTPLAGLVGNEQCAELVRLVGNNTEVINLLSNPDLGATIFCPTNAAIAALNGSVPTGADLNRTIFNHIVLAAPLTAAVIPAGPTNLTTGSSDSISVAKDANNNVTITSGNATANVVAADQLAGKSVIHSINAVLVPAGVTLGPGSPPPGPLPNVTSGAQYATVGLALASLGAGGSALAALAARLNQTALLDNPSLQAMIFVPTEQAFAAYNASNPNTAADVQNATFLYHIVPTAQPKYNLTAQNASFAVATALTGQPLPAGVNNITTNITFTTQANQTLMLLSGVAPGGLVNIQNVTTAANSTVYMVDAVLMPPMTPPVPLTLRQALQGNPNFTVLPAIIAADPTMAPLLDDPDLAVTIFAPTDAAINTTLATLNMTLDTLRNTQAARLLVLSHILPQRPYTAAIIPQGTTTLPAVTNVTLSINNQNGNVTVAGPGNAQQPVSVVQPDVLSGKSVVHVINGVILPPLDALMAPEAPSGSPIGAGGIVIPAPAPPIPQIGTGGQVPPPSTAVPPPPGASGPAPPPGQGGTTPPPPPGNNGGVPAPAPGSQIGNTPSPPPPAGGAATTASASTPLMVLSALLGAVMMVTMTVGSSTCM